ncbi:MAG: DUF4091 domain-containing protein [Bacteroidetes bacterium]|nr:DUF4091 domain-containing protein [Bacteroidota bacterium]
MMNDKCITKMIVFVIFILFWHQGMEVCAQGISAIWVNEGGDKVAQEELRVGQPNGRAVINHIWDGTKVKIKGAKNEVVNFNVVIEAAIQQATEVNVAFGLLTCPESSVIQSSPASGDGVFNWVGRNIELFYVRYLQIRGLSLMGYETYDERHIPERLRRPYDENGSGTGLWTDRPDHDKHYPEIAVPLELVPSFTIEQQKNQSIWVDIYIPKNAAAGLYTGAVQITESGDHNYVVPVELTVYDFALPDMPTAKTMLAFSGGEINERFFGQGWIQGDDEDDAKLIQDRHFMITHRHKISLIGDDSWINSDYTSDDHPADDLSERLKGDFFTSANGYDGPGVNVGNNVYSVHTYGIPDSWKSDTAMRRHSDNWVNWFEANSPETDYFLYLIDESSNFLQIETWSQWLANNPGPGSRLKSMVTIQLPDAVANTPSLVIPASTATIGITDVWENAANQYIGDPVKQFMLYNGARPAAGSFATDDDGVALRVTAWTQFKKHVNRWFYWEATYYDDFQAGAGKVDLFQSARTFGSFTKTDAEKGETGYNYSNGDGVLLYPGTDCLFPNSSYNVKGPFASLRMKYWRRGLQDHDYLTMASEINPQAVQNIVNSIIPKVVWEVGVEELSDPTWIRTDISWSTNPDTWEAARDSLAKIILSGCTEVTEISLPQEMRLYQNYPNPFNPNTMISYKLKVRGEVVLKVYDILGREIAVLVNEVKNAGDYTVEWNGTNSSGQKAGSGVYFYQLKCESGFSKTMKMILLN